MKSLIALLLLTASPLLLAKNTIWQVSDGDQQMFLVGTIHVLSEDDLPLPAIYDTLFQKSDVLFFETDLAAIGTPSFQQMLQQKAFYPSGKSLADVLSEPANNQLQQYIADNKLSADAFYKMRPGMASLTIAMLEMMRLGMTQQGVDFTYFQKAQVSEKPTVALETLEQHVDFIVNMGGGDPSQLILKTLQDVDKMPSLLSTLRTAWKTGDSQTLKHEFVEVMQKDYPNMYQQLLVQRNQQWMPKLVSAMKNDKTEMVLVGAAHLFGKDGLLAMLEAKGFTITQL